MDEPYCHLKLSCLCVLCDFHMTFTLKATSCPCCDFSVTFFRGECVKAEAPGWTCRKEQTSQCAIKHHLLPAKHYHLLTLLCNATRKKAQQLFCLCIKLFTSFHNSVSFFYSWFVFYEILLQLCCSHAMDRCSDPAVAVAIFTWRD